MSVYRTIGPLVINLHLVNINAYTCKCICNLDEFNLIVIKILSGNEILKPIRGGNLVKKAIK